MSHGKTVLRVSLLCMGVLLGSCATRPFGGHPITIGFKNLLAGDLSNCAFKAGSWAIEDGVLTRKGGGDIWTKDAYGDFILDLEFKVAEGTNSGIFFRTADIENWLHTGIEIQVYDSYGREKPGKHDCGAVYDVLEPSANAVKPAGEWNRITIMAKGSMVNIVMNGKEIIDMDLNDWPEAHKNPDGTKNKFNIAYKDMARVGAFGFQDHGKPVWYRNIKVKRLN
ncbi:MAG: DUF1080 domain-containing protein [Phycisphaerales bacterium]|nr:MAG: DUF1080 domain-containing protein [Phycisphaerales bacterium]